MYTEMEDFSSVGIIKQLWQIEDTNKNLIAAPNSKIGFV
jgi:hypothetical protein